MKTKALLFLIFFGLALGISFAFTDDKEEKEEKLSIEKQIDLAGHFPKGTLRSSFNPFSAVLTTTTLEVNYLTNLTGIDIEIITEAGAPVYNETVNPSAGEQLIIPVSGWAEGNYTITFTNTSGGYIYGEFTLE